MTTLTDSKSVDVQPSTGTAGPASDADGVAASQPAVGASGGSASDGTVGSLRSAMVAELVRPVVTNDHVVVGRLFVVTSAVLALGAAVLGVLLRLELVDAGGINIFSDVNSWFQMWALHRTAFVMLAVMPMMIGLAMVAVPAQIGADSLAFPRAALGAFWCWLIGSAITISSVLGGGGWGSLDSASRTDRDAIALTVLGMAMTICSLLLAALVLATTVISLRKPGMTLGEVPPFAWSMLVASVVWLLTLPIALANIVLVYTDLRGRTPISLGQPEGIGIWSQLDWITEPPTVYALAVPVLGIAVEMARVKAGHTEGGRQRGDPNRPALAAAAAIGLFGLLSIGGWAQDFFTADTASAADTVSAADAMSAADTAPAADTVSAAADGSGGLRYELLYTAFASAAVLPVLVLAVVVLAQLLKSAWREVSGEAWKAGEGRQEGQRDSGRENPKASQQRSTPCCCCRSPQDQRVRWPG